MSVKHSPNQQVDHYKGDPADSVSLADHPRLLAVIQVKFFDSLPVGEDADQNHKSDRDHVDKVVSEVERLIHDRDSFVEFLREARGFLFCIALSALSMIGGMAIGMQTCQRIATSSGAL